MNLFFLPLSLTSWILPVSAQKLMLNEMIPSEWMGVAGCVIEKKIQNNDSRITQNVISRLRKQWC